MMYYLIPLSLLTMMCSSWPATICILSTMMPIMVMSLINPIVSMSNFSLTDNLSTPLIMLTVWTSMLMILSSTNIYKFNTRPMMFNTMTLILMSSLLIAFSVNNLIMYYIFFEMSLIPTLIIIVTWGYQPERLMATMYLMMYTLIASLPLLMAIIYTFYEINSTMFFINNNYNPFTITKIMLIMAFIVKMPLYLFHFWLPKAHVEAPVAGSMILASVLLKLGSYGLIRMMLLFPSISFKINIVLVPLSMIGATLTAFLCIRQQDMKELIAYASVSHMSLMLASLLTHSQWGLTSAMMLNISHGLASSLLFSLSNSFYEYSHTRNLYLNKGMLSISPTLTTWWFLAIMANMAAPPTLNLLSEMMMFVTLFNFSLTSIMAILLVPFMSVVYSILFYLSTSHGKPSPYIIWFMTSNKHSLTAILHIIPLYLMISASHILTL